MTTDAEAGRTTSSTEEAAMSGDSHEEPSALALGAVSALRAYGEAIQRRVASSATPSGIPPEMEKDCCRTPRDEQGHAQNCRPPSERTRLIREQQRDPTEVITAIMVSGDTEVIDVPCPHDPTGTSPYACACEEG